MVGLAKQSICLFSNYILNLHVVKNLLSHWRESGPVVEQSVAGSVGGGSVVRPGRVGWWVARMGHGSR